MEIKGSAPGKENRPKTIADIEQGRWALDVEGYVLYKEPADYFICIGPESPVEIIDDKNKILQQSLFLRYLEPGEQIVITI